MAWFREDEDFLVPVLTSAAVLAFASSAFYFAVAFFLAALLDAATSLF